MCVRRLRKIVRTMRRTVATGLRCIGLDEELAFAMARNQYNSCVRNSVVRCL